MIKADHAGGILAGTGVWMGKGLVLTSFHLVGNSSTGDITAHEIRLSQPHLGWEEESLAEVVAVDSSLDLAVLRCEEAISLPSPRLGDPDRLTSGDTVYAVGHEFFFPQGIGILYPRDGEISGMEESFFIISPPLIRGFSGGGVFNRLYRKQD